MRKNFAWRIAQRRKGKPESSIIEIPADIQTAISRVDQLAKSARAGWFGLLFLLVFSVVTLSRIRDVDFFKPGSQTELPILGLSIPTSMFFALGPPLIAALYGNLHFHLLKLWGALSPAHLPAKVIKLPVSDHLIASMLIDLALHFRLDGALRRHDLQLLTSILTFSLVFLLAPAVLVWMWLRSMRSLDEVLTVLCCGLPLAFVLHIMCSSLAVIWTRCSCMRRRQSLFSAIRFLPWPRRHRTSSRLVFIILVVSGLGWFRTEGTLDYYAHKLIDGGLSRIDSPEIPQSWWRGTPWPEFLASPDLAGEVLVELPVGWLPRRLAQNLHRELWCNKNALPLAICPAKARDTNSFGQPTIDKDPPIVLTLAHRTHCAEFVASTTPELECIGAFKNYRELMKADWRTERWLTLSQIPIIDLSGRDLRGADIQGAIMVRANLQNARLDDAIAKNAVLESSDLSESRLQRVDFQYAELQQVSLTEAKMHNAFFGEAWLERAYLRNTNAQGANFSEAHMRDVIILSSILDDASFTSAHLYGTYFESGSLERASFAGTRMQNVSFAHLRMSNARFEGANLRGSSFRNIELLNAEFHRMNMVGTLFNNVDFGERAKFIGVDFRGAALRSMSAANLLQLQPFWSDLFSDGSIRQGYEGLRAEDPNLTSWPPENWATEVLEYRPWDVDNSPFHKAWLSRVSDSLPETVIDFD